VVPLLHIGVDIGGITAVSLLKQRKGTVRTDRQRPDQLFEILSVLLAISESDLDALIGPAVIRISKHESACRVIVTGVGLDIEGFDHAAGNHSFQIAKTEIV
jgi:hypothetical protein